MIPLIFLLAITCDLKNLKVDQYFFLLIFFFLLTSFSILTNDEYISIFFYFFGYVILYILILNYIKTSNDIEFKLNVYLIGLFIVCIVSAASLLDFFNFTKLVGKNFIEFWYGTPVLVGTTNNPNAFASFLIPGTVLMYALSVKSKSVSLKLISLLGALFFLIFTFLTLSRSGIGGAILGCLIVNQYAKTMKLFNYKFLLTLAYLILSFFLFLYLYEVLLNYFMQNASVSQANMLIENKTASGSYRILVLPHLFEALFHSPIIGIGYGNVNEFLYKKIGLNIGAHNIFFGIGIEFGLIAMIVFSVAIICSVLGYFNTLKNILNKRSRIVIASCFGSFLGLLFHGIFHEIYVNFLLWLFLILGLQIKKKLIYN